MKAVRSLSRRSFLISVAGASVAGAAACTAPAAQDQQWDPLDNAAPKDRGRVRPGREGRPTRCSDGDTGPRADQHDHGRHCAQR